MVFILLLKFTKGFEINSLCIVMSFVLLLKGYRKQIATQCFCLYLCVQRFDKSGNTKHTKLSKTRKSQGVKGLKRVIAQLKTQI